MKPSTIARAIIKLAIFAFFVCALVKPFVLLLLSVANDNTDPGVVGFVARSMGILAQLTILYMGMFVSYVVTRKLRHYRLLQIVTGFALMGGIYWLAKYACLQVVSWIAALVSGMFTVALIVVIALAALCIFLWAATGPWAFIACLMLKDDQN